MSENLYLPFKQVLQEVQACPVELIGLTTATHPNNDAPYYTGSCVVKFLSEKLDHYRVGIDFEVYRQQNEVKIGLTVNSEGQTENLFPLVSDEDKQDAYLSTYSLEEELRDGEEVVCLNLMSTNCLCVDHSAPLRTALLKHFAENSLAI